MEYTKEIAQAFELVKEVVSVDGKTTAKEKQSIIFDLCWVENNLKGE